MPAIRHDVSASELAAMVEAEYRALGIGQVDYSARTGIDRKALVGFLRRKAGFLYSFPAVAQTALLFGYDRDAALIATGNLTPALVQFVTTRATRDVKLVRAAHEAVQYRRRQMR